jgi:hypothetical protein
VNADEQAAKLMAEYQPHRGISRDELLAALREPWMIAVDADTELVHHRADDLLLHYINDPEIAAAYDAVPKWYA